MTPTALSIIRNEHQALAAILHALRRTVSDMLHRHAKPDFDVLRALLFYIDAFPERLHHPKENSALFARLRERAPSLAPVLDHLEAEHAHGEQAIRDLQHQLLEYEMLGAHLLPAFAAAVEHYCECSMEHMHREETDVLPAAERLLGSDEWQAINAAFETNRDPLTGYPPEQTFEALFARIVNLLPPPLGLGLTRTP
ncbi:hemerythrin domain-containing protein [Azoarcus sp. L1K30]|uniref:hemerythrin domain-containing protein n=1 Tax=Azoarcus sp. L1K30 TaxID=2820277 RepID=UPI001B84260F|nr:hemerythrin domain-containing protein [Azoarcus sp. L1K30]MBR0564711.1 hemerythrin domain-containing protein [Azoarcus sp. L1K30]